MSRIAVIGTGYVGLVAGACFADFGAKVTCIDKDPVKVASLKRGQIPIHEPGLDALVARNVRAGRLVFTTDLAEPVAAADIVFLAVGTPTDADTGNADLRGLFAAADVLAAAMTSYTLLATKSTVPVGTGTRLRDRIRAARPDLDFDQVETIIEQEVSLCVKLLRFLNSAAFGYQRRVDSVRQGLTLLGERPLKKWAVLPPHSVTFGDECVADALKRRPPNA